MKKIINLKIVTIIALFFVFACEDEMHLLENNTILGATVTTSSNSVLDLPISDDSASFSSTLTISAPDNAKSVERIDVFVAFKDIINGGTDASTEKKLFESIPASSFINNIGDAFRPVIDYSLSKLDMISTSEISANDVDGGDSFVITFTVVLKNGNTFNNSYVSNVVCPSTTPPTSGTWVLTMQDAFSDSWDGASLTITIDGVSTNYSMSCCSSEQQFNIDVPNGASSLIAVYNETSPYPEEHKFQLVSASGKTVASAGPFVNNGRNVIIDLDYCAF